MNRVAAGLSRLVRRAPLIVVLLVVLLTAGLAGLSTQVETATGNEGFAPDNPQLEAIETIGERFEGAGEEVLQVLVTGPDVVSADGLEAAEAVHAAIADSPAGAHLAERPERPAVVTWLDPVRQALAGMPPEAPVDGAPDALSDEAALDGAPDETALDGAPNAAPDEAAVDGTPADAPGAGAQGGDAGAPMPPAAGAPPDDATVKAIFADVLAALPAEQSGLVTGLLADDADLSGEPAADSALVLVFLRTSELVPDDASGSEQFDALIEAQTDVADAAAEAELPAGYEASSFSFPLLFADTDAFESELTRLFGSAFVIILVLLAFVYWLRPGLGLTAVAGGRRTVADVLLTLATIVMAITWMNGFAVLLGPGYLGLIGGLTEVTQIVPVLLIGLGVDYAIHLTARYREELGAGASVPEAVGRAVNTVGVALVLATVTTAVGFLTNLVNPVPALKDFGVLAAIGIVAAFLLMLTFVPAVRLLLDRRAERLGRLPKQAFVRSSERILPGIMARTAVLAERAPVATLLVTVVLGGALGGWGMSRLETRFSATDFVSDESPVVATMDAILDRFGGGFGESTDVLITGDVATPAAHNGLVTALDDLADVPDVATYGDRVQAESPVGLLGLLLAPGPDGAPAPEVAEAAAAAGVDENLRVADDADVTALYDALFAADTEAAERVVDRADDGTYTHARVSLQTNAGESRAGELAENVTAAFAPVAAAGPTTVATSTEIVNDAIVHALSDSQVSSMAVTLLAAMLLLAATFWFRNRRPGLGLLTVAPVVLVVLWTFGLMAATGIPFGPVTATIAALAIGIGVPYTIHITNRYLEERLLYVGPVAGRRDDRALTAETPIRSTVRHTGGALAGSALTTCAGFGILVTSTLTPFRQFGLVTVYAIGLAMLAATLVLPSMLTLWDRWDRRKQPPEPPPLVEERETARA